MKKIFIAVAAMSAFVACSNEVEITPSQGEAIAFGDAYVDNATKAIYETAEDIKGFQVWGNVEGTEGPVALYGDAGAAVTRGSAVLGAAWTCNVVRYWTPSCEYNFVAIANGTGAEVVNGIPTKINYTVNGAEPADLIYGAAAATTNDQCVPTGVPSGSITGDNIVTFKMAHLLSRVKVTFESDDMGDQYTYAISNVKITTWDKGVYTIGATTPWAAATDKTDVALPYTGITEELVSGKTKEAGAQLVIPGSTVNLSFDLEAKLSGATYRTETVSVANVLSSVDNAPQQNYSYNIIVSLKGGKKIDFTVDATDGLAGFTSGSDVTVQ